MKNIYLIPTDKQSNLYYSTSMYGYNLKLSEIPKPKSSEVKPIQIYITNDEEIKEGDWCIDNKNTLNKVINISNNGYVMFANGNSTKKRNYKKIILTTDQDLIADGIQKIDDDFLQWFVNTPSCEEVQVESNYRVKSGTIKEHNEGNAGYEYYEYKIIIPSKEDTKKLLENDKFCHYSGLPSPTAYKEEINPFELPNVLPDDVFNKSLEEIAEKEYPKLIVENPSCNGYNEPKHIDINEECRNAFMEGVKSDKAKEMWIKFKEAEKMYSEEDMRKMYDISCGNIGLAYVDDQTENNERFISFLNKIKK